MRRSALLVATGLVALLACEGEETTTPTQTGTPTGVAPGCYRCHGDQAKDHNSPPPALFADGLPDTHHRHLDPSSWRATMTCDSCHVVPADVGDEGHNDGMPAELEWHGLAVTDEATPEYDAATQTCTGTYCHGATLFAPGGSHLSPAWEDLDGASIQCGSCHATPPGHPHPAGADDDCAECHGEVVDWNMDIVAPELHINGIVDVKEFDCTTCHGSGSPTLLSNVAPPLDTFGNEDTAAPGVGAHQAHLESSTWRVTFGCEECHVVPSNMMDPGHVGSELPAELTWGPLASADGAAPQYDASTHTCSVYCHGSTLGPGGSNVSPDWTQVDGSQDACGTCHGAPPDNPPHPYVRVPTDCGPCHPYTGLDADDPTRHVDGVVDLVEPLACNECHGSASNDAPPSSVTGQSNTTAPGVGAHQAVLTSGMTTPLDCPDCHATPILWTDAGHYDSDLPAEVIFGHRAQQGNHNPSHTLSTCANTYCHDANPNDSASSKTVPGWTTVDGTHGDCDSCHGYPPQHGTHPFDSDCSSCHGMVVAADDVTITSPTLHINGTMNHN